MTQQSNQSFNNTTSNLTLPIDFSLKLRPLHIALLCFYPLVAVLGVGGNVYVIKWFYSKQKRNIAGSSLVVVLACNDLLASIMVPSAQIHLIISFNKYPFNAWYLGELLCSTLQEFSVVFLLATSWILVVIALERYK